jgi:hypothetical protein
MANNNNSSNNNMANKLHIGACARVCMYISCTCSFLCLLLPLLVGALEALGQIVRVDLDGGVVDAVPRTRLLRSAQHLALLGSLLRSVPAPSACERRGMQWW